MKSIFAKFDDHFIGNQWWHSDWPTLQWRLRAAVVNQFARQEVSLVDVLRLRIAERSTEHHRRYSAAVLRVMIEEEMSGAIRDKWLAALAEALDPTKNHPRRAPSEAPLCSACWCAGRRHD